MYALLSNGFSLHYFTLFSLGKIYNPFFQAFVFVLLICVFIKRKRIWCFLFLFQHMFPWCHFLERWNLCFSFTKYGVWKIVAKYLQILSMPPCFDTVMLIEFFKWVILLEFWIHAFSYYWSFEYTMKFMLFCHKIWRMTNCC